MFPINRSAPPTPPIDAYLAFWRQEIIRCVKEYRDNSPLDDTHIRMLISTEARNGDIACPLFPIAKQYECAINELGEALSANIAQTIDGDTWGRAEFTAGYLNIFLPRARYSDALTRYAHECAERYGANTSLRDMRIMIEFSSPNSNKPLHLGHLRNNALGESLSRIFTQCGAQTHKVNLINDRGIHICKAMAAYQRYANNDTPRTTGVKTDHFVGEYYVRYNNWEKENEHEAKEHARRLLVLWENNHPDTRRLWNMMRRWALDGHNATYTRTGISFDNAQYESDTYLLGKEIVRQGMDNGVFYRAADNSIEIDCTDIGLDIKKVLRADGTSIYLTQDLGTAYMRYTNWKFNRLLYVVASEQRYHFQVLFEILKRLRAPFSSSLLHCSYGMVRLPHGKMKSREGTVVDADWLIDILRDKIIDEIKLRNETARDNGAAHERERNAENMAIASLHYWLLKTEAKRDILFEIDKSIALNGHSGIYILYVLTRIRSILDNAGYTDETIRDVANREEIGAHLQETTEWELIMSISRYPQIVEQAADAHDPHPISAYVYSLAKLFSRYYHETPIAVEKNSSIRTARLVLVAAIKQTVENCCHALCMPTVTKM